MKLLGILLAFIGRILLPHSVRQLESTIRGTNAHRPMRRSPPGKPGGDHPQANPYRSLDYCFSSEVKGIGGQSRSNEGS